MAITVNSNPGSLPQPSAVRVMRILNVTLDNSYPTGGYDISAALENGTVIWSETLAVFADSAVRFLKVNRATGFLQSFAVANGVADFTTETANATDLSAVVGAEIGVYTQ